MNFFSYLESVDHSIFLDLNHDFINPFFDSFFPLLRDITYFFWIFLIVYFWVRKEKRLAIILTAGIIAGAIFTYPLKFLIDRQRPYEQLDTTRLLTPFENDPSFPSGHTEMSFLAATIISQFHPRYSKYLYGFSFIVALSRIYVGVHFPIDVIGGAIIGIVIGKLTLRRNLFKSEEI
ncbi:MAG TPA: phosphatase PAP2 family protein [Candidatus Methanoperedens sp.]|nr:phosphatase PAP2 family protein [Candidatus Methanoperedens sp.]